MNIRTVLVGLGFALALAACSGSSGGGADVPTDRFVEPGAVSSLADGTVVVTQGVLVIADDTRICEVLVGGAVVQGDPLTFVPPQCGGDSVVLADLDPNDVVALETVGGSEGGEVKLANYPLAVVGTVEGGILVDTAIAARVYEEVSNGLRIRLTPAQEPFFPQQLRVGETIWWAVDLTNVTDEAIPMTFSSAQVAEVTISDGDTELYRWSNDKTFAQQIRQIDFAAGQTAGATLKDTSTTGPGTNYTVRAWVTAVGADDVVVTAQVDLIENRATNSEQTSGLGLVARDS